MSFKVLRIKCAFTWSNVSLPDQKYMVTDAISKTKMVAQIIQWSGVIGEFKKLADPVRQTGSISVIQSGFKKKPDPVGSHL